ncbi:MAG: hypothetical protein M9894_03135 [Planctomycetes bacterium]|nr:hypothetical protein [Planctomycetota bacterium]
MRGAALLVALALPSAARAEEAPLDLDLHAFADHLTDALDLEGVEAWEERLDPAAEEAWLAGREDEPGFGDEGPRVPAVVGATARGRDLAVTRLVAPDAARARALALRALEGFALPLGAGPGGSAPARLPLLLEARGRHLLLVRGLAAADLTRALPARAAAWEAPGLPPPDAPVEGVAVVADGHAALAFVGEGPVVERLRRFVDPAFTPGAMGVFGGFHEGVHYHASLSGEAGAGWSAGSEDARPAARALARRLAATLGVPFVDEADR